MSETFVLSPQAVAISSPSWIVLTIEQVSNTVFPRGEIFQKRYPECETWDLMLLAETSLRKEWDTPEEDEAWADL